jgi:hypothetical protein
MGDPSCCKSGQLQSQLVKLDELSMDRKTSHSLPRSSSPVQAMRGGSFLLRQRAI